MGGKLLYHLSLYDISFWVGIIILMNEIDQGKFIPPQSPDWGKHIESQRNPENPLNIDIVDTMLNDAINGVDDDKIEIDYYLDSLCKTDQKRERGLRDVLTGCRNRNYFEEFKREFEEDFDPGRNNNQLGFIFVDLNGLKIVNDSKGHSAGDDLLIEAVKILKENFRKGDHVYRIGGDEFVIVCKNVENDNEFEDNLTKKINSEKLRNASVSMSFGLAVFNKDTDFSLDDTLKRADDNMYYDKHSANIFNPLKSSNPIYLVTPPQIVEINNDQEV